MAEFHECNNFNFQKLTKEGRVLLKFYTDTCVPCKQIDNELEQIENVKVVKINAGRQELLKENFEVMSVPTVILLEDGKEIDRFNGFRPVAFIEEFIS